VGVRNTGTHRGHSSGGVDRVFDHRDGAVGTALLARNGNIDGRASLRHSDTQLGQQPLRDRECDVNGCELIDVGDRCGVGLTYKVADLHGGLADAPADGRPYAAKAELDLEIFQCGGIRLDGGTKRVDLRLGILDVKLSSCAFGKQFRTAAQVALCACQLCVV